MASAVVTSLFIINIVALVERHFAIAQTAKKAFYERSRRGFLLVRCSVTRFGEISPLWTTFFGHSPRIYFVFGKILNLLWQKFYVIGQIFIVVNGQN